VFLFVEPLSNLDAKLRVQMRHEIRRIHNQIKATSIFVTHDQHEGMTLADRLVVMNKGTIEQVGTPSEIYDQPASTYVAGFIGSPAMNFLPGQYSAARRGVLLDGGALVPLTGDRGLTDGQLVQLGIRPEHAVLTGAGKGMIEAELEIVEELGSARHCNLSVEDIPFSLVTESRPAIEPGTTVGITFPPEMVHVFDGQTGRRVGTHPTNKGLPISSENTARATGLAP
jgi:ABC-type sugar transport system ATPase subunit